MLVSKRKATEMGLLEAQGRYRRRMDLSCFLGFRDALVLSQQRRQRWHSLCMLIDSPWRAPKRGKEHDWKYILDIKLSRVLKYCEPQTVNGQ